MTSSSSVSGFVIVFLHLSWQLQYEQQAMLFATQTHDFFVQLLHLQGCISSSGIAGMVISRGLILLSFCV